MDSRQKNSFEEKNVYSADNNKYKKSPIRIIEDDHKEEVVSEQINVFTARNTSRGNETNLIKMYSSDTDRYSETTTYNFDRKYVLILER